MATKETMIEDRNYRLSHCSGFAVADPGGRIGVVEELEYASRSDRPDYLVVRRGHIRRTRIRVGVEQVVEIDLDRRRVLILGAPVGRVRWSKLPEELADEAEATLTAVPERGARS